MTAGGIQAAIQEHLDACRELGLRTTSIDQRRYALRRLARHVDGRDLLDLTAEDLREWRRTLGTLTPQSICSEVGHVAKFYAWSIDRGLIVESPAAKLPRPKRPYRVPRPIDEKDLRRAIENAPRHIRPWLVLAGWCGLRAAEIAMLERQQILDTAVPPVIVVVNGKGGRDRIVPLGVRVIEELHRFGLPSRGFVFGRQDGATGPNSPARVSQAANRYLHELGITATLHQLRHRYGTQMYRVSLDIRLVQECMGHNDPNTTAGYVAYCRDKAVDAVAALDASVPQ